jgi:hypothetical protein
MRMVIYLQIPTIFWRDGWINSVTYWLYMVLMTLGRQKCIQTELLVPEPSSFKTENAIEKLTSYKSPGTDQILAEKSQSRGNNTLCSEIHNLLILLQIRKNCHSGGRNQSLYLFLRIKELTVVIIREYHCYQLCIKFYPILFSQG